MKLRLLLISLMCAMSLSLLANELTWFDGRNPVSYQVVGKTDPVVKIALDMFYTAVCYATGQGTAANKAEARKWMQKAAAQNDDPQVKQAAQEALKQM